MGPKRSLFLLLSEGMQYIFPVFLLSALILSPTLCADELTAGQKSAIAIQKSKATMAAWVNGLKDLEPGEKSAVTAYDQTLDGYVTDSQKIKDDNEVGPHDEGFDSTSLCRDMEQKAKAIVGFMRVFDARRNEAKDLVKEVEKNAKDCAMHVSNALADGGTSELVRKTLDLAWAEAIKAGTSTNVLTAINIADTDRDIKKNSHKPKEDTNQLLPPLLESMRAKYKYSLTLVTKSFFSIQDAYKTFIDRQTEKAKQAAAKSRATEDANEAKIQAEEARKAAEEAKQSLNDYKALPRRGSSVSVQEQTAMDETEKAVNEAQAAATAAASAKRPNSGGGPVNPPSNNNVNKPPPVNPPTPKPNDNKSNNQIADQTGGDNGHGSGAVRVATVGWLVKSAFHSGLLFLLAYFPTD